MRFAQTLRPVVMTLAAMALTAVQAVAADRDKVEAFLTVTGFDVALESIKLSAEDAPRMLGLQAEDFGAAWTLMSNSSFPPAPPLDGFSCSESAPKHRSAPCRCGSLLSGLIRDTDLRGIAWLQR